MDILVISAVFLLLLVLGLPIGTVKNRIFRARQILMENLKDYR